nr:MAG TPA: hypothetical protein [Caudoviricetes sp.]
MYRICRFLNIGKKLSSLISLDALPSLFLNVIIRFSSTLMYSSN